MTPEETVNKSILDKPLHQLTEEDISQLTRENCRRYLKDKGMRRPSWNKSQAIQQVISLKTLLEPASDSDAAAAHKKHYIPRPSSPPNRVPRGTSADTEISDSADELVPYPRKDPKFKPVHSGDSPAGLVPDKESVPPRTTGVANVSVEQMTIFYCGKVNVYDDVPADKAQTIMQLAASPLLFPQEILYDGTTEVRALPCHLQAASVKVGSDSSAMLLPTLQTTDSPASRKALVQRYLEKQKDRLRSKGKVGTPSSASLDVYLNHQIVTWAPNENSGRSGACSPIPIKPPSMINCSGSVENNRVKGANLSAVMGDKGLLISLSVQPSSLVPVVIVFIFLTLMSAVSRRQSAPFYSLTRKMASSLTN